MIAGFTTALALLRSPIGMLLAGAIGIGGVYLYGHHKGHSGAMAACQEAALRAELAAAKVDREAAQRVADDAIRSAREDAARAAKLEEENRDYEAELAKRPEADGCRIIDRDLRRLR